MFSTQKPDEAWMARLRSRRFTADTVFPDPKLEALKRKLLLMGGYAVILAFDEPHFQQIMERGSLTSGHSSLKRMTDSDCHRNAYRLAMALPENKLWTGWALSPDGAWRQHSWVVNDGHIIETTVRRTAYFGFEVTGEDLERWNG